MDPSNDALLGLLADHRTVEALAAVEHERWAHWQQYLHEQCARNDDGSLTIPAPLVSRWASQMATPYAELSESEKESDREQVREYIATLRRLS